MPAIDVAVVGGGIVGLSVARALRGRGARVVLFEASRSGGEATGAAAGILSLLAESLDPAAPVLWPLVQEAMACFPTFVEELRAEAPVDVEHDRRGLLLAAFGPTEEEAISEALVRAARLGIRAVKVSGAEARRLEPGLSAAVVSALHAPADGQVDPRLLVRALLTSCRERGVDLREGLRVRSIVAGEGGPEVALDAGNLAVGKVVVAAGAWSSQLGVPPLRAADVVPCRGQMLVFLKDGLSFSGPVLYRPGHGYLLSRRDGRVLAGSTVEPGATERVVTAQGLATLARNAVALLPAIADAPLVDSWAGLRPQAKDGLPVLGESDRPGVHLATGLFKSGIMLGPLVAELVADALEGKPPRVDLAPFSPSRFRGTPAGAADQRP